MVLPHLCLVLTCFLVSGCALVVIPQAPHDHTTAYLLDSGRTSSLIIPNESGGLTRYTYGDWDWYALRETEWWRAIPALLWPTQGALGRMPLEGPEDLAKLSQEAENMYAIPVDRQRALALSRRLDGEFDAQIATLVQTPSVGLDFVHHGHWYWAAHNSNHATAGWLHDLGVKTRGYPAWSSWQIREPREEPAKTMKPTRGPASSSAIHEQDHP